MDREKRYFVLGMITAFSECVAGGCKRLALSPPLEPDECGEIAEEAFDIIEKHGLIHYVEHNEELPEKERWEWILIAARPGTIGEYLALRAKGESPARSLEAFHGLLSYNPDEGVHTGYDAFRACFPKNGCASAR